MKTRTITLAMIAGAIITATAREPQGRKGDLPPPGMPPVPPIFALFDKNRDGVISSDEIENAAKVLGKFDKDNDGKITLKEMRPPKHEDGDTPQGPPPGVHRPPPLIVALDADKDGTLSADELKNAPESLLKLDKNKDGELSPEEIHPHGPPPPPQGGPDGDGPPPEDGAEPPAQVE
jgi:Ca2+-binding EF-hand superfamily protein